MVLRQDVSAEGCSRCSHIEYLFSFVFSYITRSLLNNGIHMRVERSTPCNHAEKCKENNVNACIYFKYVYI
jgi:hypothetical protein